MKHLKLFLLLFFIKSAECATPYKAHNIISLGTAISNKINKNNKELNFYLFDDFSLVLESRTTITGDENLKLITEPFAMFKIGHDQAAFLGIGFKSNKYCLNLGLGFKNENLRYSSIKEEEKRKQSLAGLISFDYFINSDTKMFIMFEKEIYQFKDDDLSQINISFGATTEIYNKPIERDIILLQFIKFWSFYYPTDTKIFISIKN